MKVLVSIVIILILCAYSYTYGPKQSSYYVDCLKHPEDCEGKEVVAVVGRVSSVGSNSFEMISAGETIPVEGSIRGITRGKYLDVIGTFHKGKSLKLTGYHLYRERKLKVSLSLIPVFIVAYLFVKNFGLKRSTPA